MQWIYGTRICYARPVLNKIGCLQFWCFSFGNCKWSKKQLLSKWRNRGGPNKLCKYDYLKLLNDCMKLEFILKMLQAWKNWRQGTAMNIVDPTLRDGSRNEMMRCIHIGLLCVQENVGDRPTMATVILMLNSFSVTLPMPSQPAFFMHTNIESDMSSSLVSESYQSRSDELPLSQNEASITDPYPR